MKPRVFVVQPGVVAGKPRLKGIAVGGTEGVGCTDKTVGLIGVGRVGREAALRLSSFDMRVIYTKRTRLGPDEEADLHLEWVDRLDDLLAQSDYVVMMADYNPSAHEMMSAREFALMKPSAFFLNTGRGRLVNEADMIAALQAGTIAGAGLDVYDDEPPVVHEHDRVRKGKA